MVLAPGILVLAITLESEVDHCLLLIRGRPRDVWVVTDPTVGEGKFRFKHSEDAGPDYLIIHPRHCRKSSGGQADEGV